MGFDDGSIVLDSPNGAYYAGQTVFGRLIFEQRKPKTIHGIYISCKGFCKVHWTTTEHRRVDDRSVTDTIVHESYEEYFNRKTYVFGGESGEHNLHQGEHEFRFDCPIPNNCPSTFEGTFGHVRYRVKAVMVTSGIFSSNKEKMVPIKVHAPLDLNQNPYCREPIEIDITSTYCCWCVSSGSSEIKVRLPVGGYCPGQVIPIEVSVVNLSGVDIDTIKFSLRKNIKFEAAHRVGTKSENESIAEMKKGPVAAGTNRNWTVEMDVPVMDIYNLNACRYIDINYWFHVATEVSGCHEDEEENRPIIFGTIPLIGFQDTVPNPLQDQLPQPVNSQGVNNYPGAPITNQPMSNSPYPNGYPQNTPYPSGVPYPTPPNVTPYPPAPTVSPYPGNQPPPYPNVSPYPNSNPPYSNNASPYPPTTTPYPTNTPYSPGNLPPPSPVPGYPGRSPSPVPPYPGGTPGQHYPGSSPNVVNTSLVKTGNPGFVVPGVGDPAKMPLLPPTANVPYPGTPASNPYATASAPEPATPGSGNIPEVTAPYPAYNPDFEFVPDAKKDEKHN